MTVFILNFEAYRQIKKPPRDGAAFFCMVAYLAYSIMRVSRIIVILILPG